DACPLTDYRTEPFE
ncbi:unnamed protein product, partial [Oikopleura dioica]